jgi:hypothetical protein
VRKDKSSRDLVNNSDPVITAAAASEGHKNELFQRPLNSVGGDVMLDIFRNALAEALNGETEQSTPHRDTVPGRRVPFPLKRI